MTKKTGKLGQIFDITITVKNCSRYKFDAADVHSIMMEALKELDIRIFRIESVRCSLSSREEKSLRN